MVSSTLLEDKFTLPEILNWSLHYGWERSLADWSKTDEKCNACLRTSRCDSHCPGKSNQPLRVRNVDSLRSAVWISPRCMVWWTCYSSGYNREIWIGCLSSLKLCNQFNMFIKTMFKYLFWLGTREAMILDPANTQEDNFKKNNKSSKILF